MIVVLFQKQLKRPHNDNNLLLSGCNESKLWAFTLRTIAGHYGSSAEPAAMLRKHLRHVADVIDPRPGAVEFPREWVAAE